MPARMMDTGLNLCSAFRRHGFQNHGHVEPQEVTNSCTPSTLMGKQQPALQQTPPNPNRPEWAPLGLKLLNKVVDVYLHI